MNTHTDVAELFKQKPQPIDAAKIRPSTIEKHDVVIIGSSPMALVEASMRAERGDNVCIVEAQSGLGGAWGVEDCLGLSRIETSPHVFMPDDASNKVMKRFLPSEYEELPHPPRLMIRWSKFFGDFVLMDMTQRYKEAWVLHVMAHYEKGKGNKISRWWKTFSEAKRTWAYRKKNKQTGPLIYPKHGLAKWLDDIESHLVSLGVTIKTNTRIEEVHVKKGTISLNGSDGIIYRPKQLCYSRMFHTDRFVYNGDEIKLSYEDDASQHIVFIVKNIRPTTILPFWRLMKDGYFMFFNDITRYSKEFREKYPGCRLVNTRLYAYRAFTPSQIKTYFKHMSFVGYLPKEAEMVDFHYRYHCPKKMAYAEEYRLKKMLGKNAYELKSGTVGLHNGLRARYGKVLAEENSSSRSAN